MARKSRKNPNNSKLTKEKIYNVGVYVRLSKINSITNDDTIANQKNIIFSYMKDKKDLKLVQVYEDTNKTGTNFNRNGFESLLNDIKLGKINCIIVKDLSRFGRNYIECCNYIEKIFPFIGVRFIAITDNFDSNNDNSSELLTVNLKNIINEMYAKDISKKVSSSLNIKKQNGQFTGSYASYGYLKDEDDKNKIIINNETAPIVKRIFNLRLEGYSYTKIAIILNDENIPSPMAYLYNKNIVKKQNFKDSKWNFNNIKTILSNEIYIGNMVQGKKKCTTIHKAKRTDKNNWIIVENTHEPIIEKDIFYKVQEINQNAKKDYTDKNKNPKLSTENIFKNFVKCGECGKRLIRRELTYKGNIKPIFVCKSHDIKQCSFTSFKEYDLKNIVFNAVQNQINICVDLDNILFKNKNITNLETENINLNIKSLNKELNKTRNLLNTIYEDYTDNLLNKSEYKLLKNSYIKKENDLLLQIELLEKELNTIKYNISRETNFLSTFLNFKDENLLTRDIIEMLINEIIIYSNKNVEIKFNFIDEYQQLLNRLRGASNGNI